MLRVASAVVVYFLIATAAFAAPAFESRLGPPRALDGIRPGMAVVDARTALAAFAADESYKDAANRTRLVKEAGDGARIYVLVKGEVISRIGVEAAERGLEAKLVKLWGAPARMTNLAREAIASWTKGDWRADLSCRNAVCRMAFHQPLTAAFFGATVAPPGALAMLRPGMHRDDIAKLVPLYAGGSDVPAGPEDVRITIDLEHTGYLRSILVGGLPPNAGELLARAWGAPDVTARGPEWIDPQLGWRAHYDASLQIVQLTGFVPAARLLGAGAAIAALPSPILGATRDQIVARYPMFRGDAKVGRLALPPTELAGAAATDVAITFGPAKRATQVAIRFPIDTPVRADSLVKVMEAKWGRAIVRKQASGRVFEFSTGNVRIEAHESRSILELQLQVR